MQDNFNDKSIIMNTNISTKKEMLIAEIVFVMLDYLAPSGVVPHITFKRRAIDELTDRTSS